MSITALIFAVIGAVMLLFGIPNLRADMKREESWLTVGIMCWCAIGFASFLAGVTSL